MNWLPILLSAAVTAGTILDTDILAGDTIEAQGVSYALDGIDAPEIGQAFGELSRAGLAGILDDGCHAWISRGKATLYTADGKDINQVMVYAGLAWADGDHYLVEEKDARVHKRGIWRYGEPEPPWLYRNRKGIKQATGDPENTAHRGSGYRFPAADIPYERTGLPL